MPDRIVRSGILTSEAVNKLTWPSEVFYRRLMSVADDFGRFDGRPAILRASLYPLILERVREADIETWIGECLEAGLVRLYSCVQNKPHIEIVKFDQRMREGAKSRWPDPHLPAGGGDSPRVAASGGESRLARARSESYSDAGSDRNANTNPRARPKTVDEIIAYGKSPHCGLSDAECRACWDHYESVGWQVQGQPVSDWKARVRVWKTRQPNHAAKTGKSAKRGESIYDLPTP